MRLLGNSSANLDDHHEEMMMILHWTIVGKNGELVLASLNIRSTIEWPVDHQERSITEDH